MEEIYSLWKVERKDEDAERDLPHNPTPRRQTGQPLVLGL